jgi:hypothetical protein
MRKNLCDKMAGSARGLMTLMAQMAPCLLCAINMYGADLEKAFHQPPPAARPWVYWFPLDGNITSNGITADLEAMARVGIGGVLYMETAQGTPPGPAKFAGPEWMALFKHACAEAHRLGLQVNMNNDAGWCGSGGPWITPEMSMQRIVWAETNLTGPVLLDARLPQAQPVKDYYRDIAVYAFPTPASNYVIPFIQGKSAAIRQEIPLRANYPTAQPESVIARERMVDLTAKLTPEGRLKWQVPAGQWTILRVGHTTTGKDNHPAPLDGRGLECDKFSKAAAELHFNNLMGRLIADNRSLVGQKRTLVSTHIDSWEVGSQNWTPKFREEFQGLRGYDPLPWLPVMSGRVVDSIELSERFLWDVRQTANDLLCANYAGHFRALAHRHGMRLSIEAYDNAPVNDLAYAGQADEPMSEFWSWSGAIPGSGHRYSSTEMASAAHVYGRPILGAEAFTATDAEKWQGHPAIIKSLGDWAFCDGVNRFVFHRYALQPWVNPDHAPGISMGPWGLHYERTQTWWEQSKAWHEYLARCQYLLQQGLFVADLCFLAPESSPQRFNSPVKEGFERPGYNFDGCPAEVVLTRMKVRDGRLVLPDGMSYRMLVLPQVETMTPRLLRKIRDLVKSGATVIGTPPEKSPSLEGYPNCDTEVKSLAAELWGAAPAPTGTDGHTVGKGRVIWPRELQPKPDASYDTATSLSQAKWIWFKEGNPARSAPPGTRYFRRTVNVAGALVSARIVMTADNTFVCLVNGQPACSGSQFKRGYGANVESLLKPGINLIAVAATNTLENANPAGLVGALTLKYRDGRVQVIPTDGTWEASKTASVNWTKATAAIPGWSPAMELGLIGMAPWGDVQEGPEDVDEIPDIKIASQILNEMGVAPDFKASANLRYIHKRLGKTEFYFVANPEPRDVEALCTFRVTGKQPELWWPDTGRTEKASAFEFQGDGTHLTLRLEPSGSVFVLFRDKISTPPAMTGKKKLAGVQTSSDDRWPVASEFSNGLGRTRARDARSTNFLERTQRSRSKTLQRYRHLPHQVHA